MYGLLGVCVLSTIMICTKKSDLMPLGFNTYLYTSTHHHQISCNSNVQCTDACVHISLASVWDNIISLTLTVNQWNITVWECICQTWHYTIGKTVAQWLNLDGHVYCHCVYTCSELVDEVLQWLDSLGIWLCLFLLAAVASPGLGKYWDLIELPPEHEREQPPRD